MDDSGGERPNGRDPGKFQTTAWTAVLQAGSDGSAARESFAELYRHYWYPLYAFLRRSGRRRQDAEDTLQGFFTWLLEKDVMARADPARGRFRNFLIKSLRNFQADEQKHWKAAKRLPKEMLLSIDAVSAESRFLAEPADELTAEKLYEQSWALAVLQRAMDHLCSECRFSGKGPCQICLSGCLTGDFDVNVRRAAETMKMTEGALRVALHRLRRRYGDLLRQEIARTVDRRDDVDDELRELMNILNP